MLERERLAHEMDLLRMEREIQREEVDAERTRSSQRDTRAKLGQNRVNTAGSRGGAQATGSGGESGSTDNASSSAGVTADDEQSQQQQPATMKKRKGKVLSEAVSKRSLEPGLTPAATADRGPREKRARQHDNKSTLFLVATAAKKGNPRGIVEALQAVPPSKLGQTSHELAVAVGDAAYQWFPPASGGEPVFAATSPGARTIQALGLMAKKEWVKARATLAAALKDSKGSKDPTSKAQSDPSAVYALALCDYHLGGAADTAQQLSDLAAAERRFWPGPPDSHAPPDARAFPLGALVRARLEASAPPPSHPEASSNLVGAGGEDGRGSAEEEHGGADGAGGGGGGGGDSPGEDDPKLRACLLAVSFLRAPTHNRKAGKVDSAQWTEAAEAVVRSTGGALSRALWGPQADDPDGEDGGGDQKKGAGDVVKSQWQRLQSKWGISSEAMDDLLNMSGLDVIKADFLSVAKLAVINRERGFDLSARSFNVRLEGNPGTGENYLAPGLA